MIIVCNFKDSSKKLVNEDLFEVALIGITNFLNKVMSVIDLAKKDKIFLTSVKYILNTEKMTKNYITFINNPKDWDIFINSLTSVYSDESKADFLKEIIEEKIEIELLKEKQRSEKEEIIKNYETMILEQKNLKK